MQFNYFNCVLINPLTPTVAIRVQL